MSAAQPMATPPEVPVDVASTHPSSCSASAASTSSLARWRLAQGMTDARASTSQTSTTPITKEKAQEADGGADERRRARRPPQVTLIDTADRKAASANGSPPHEYNPAANLASSRSGEGRAYRPIASDKVRRSVSDSQAVVGPDLRLTEQRSGDVPTAIAAAVPGIAQERIAAAEACANRWSSEVRRSTADEEDLLRAYRQLESQLRAAEKRVTAAEAKQQREVKALKAQLQEEQETRLKAEQDRDELLKQATESPALSPRTHTTPGGSVVHVSVEGGDRSHASGNGGAAAGGTGCSSSASANTATYISEAFYEKMKEREERARARVRKEFVRQAQENLYAEQKKSTEAAKAAALAVGRLQQVEEELNKAQDALQEATSVMEAKDVQLHERAIHIQELEAQLRLLQRQLDSAEEAKAQADQQARRKVEETQKLADVRQGELEAQRHFAQQLQAQLGLKTQDLIDQESNQASVLQQVRALQTRCTALEADLEAAVRETTALLDQRRQQAETDAKQMREHNEVLKKRCSAAEAEVASVKGKCESDAKEMALLRDRYAKDLSDQHVEVRSLQLQLERVLDAAKHNSAENVTAADIERQQQNALLRKYAAEATAAREELDRARAAAHRANEKHLHTVLELSQQLTALKQANTRLEHKVNAYEHESTDATRLLSRAREELSQLREERRRLSASLVDFREDSYMRSVTDEQDVWQRRTAELENVRRDLNEKLLQANQTIEDLQRRSQYAIEPNSHTSPASINVPSVRGAFLMEAQPRRSSHLSHREPDVMEHVNGDSTNCRRRQPSPPSAASATASLGLPELLESMVAQLEPIVHPHSHRVQKEEDKTRRSVSFSSSASLPFSRREHQLQQQRQSMPVEEREALDQVLASCKTALRYDSESQHVVDSPSRPRGDDHETEEEKQLRGMRENASEPTPQSLTHSSATRLSASPTQWPSSAAAPHEPPHQQQYTGAPKDDLPSPQDRIARPRRSSQPSVSSVATDEVMLRPNGTSAATPTRLPRRDAAAAAKPSSQPATHAEETRGVQRREGRCEDNGSRRGTDASLLKNIRTVQPNDRDELESEPYWDSRELEAPPTASASPPASLGALQSSPDAPPREISPALPTSAANGVMEMPDDVQSDGVLRYSRIPDEALSSIPREGSPDAFVVQPAVAVGDAASDLFRNVPYASAGSSTPRSPHQRYDPHSLTIPMTSTHPRVRQRAAIPDGALVIDVKQSTPPPPRRRYDEY
ncbi:hypothetical protein ABB37_05968 [Leptomonas pyrrhocoris]|uniref:Uncharacterized protein n=1 Tax=Leptomonas pyrrhocoris TaxID=157538 RepID=A0A0N0DUQ4_LEPPY|nr:hypothetical protein ABB37_05968 [Leptomonas pyrrhocoris]KPA78904.1 hypothetical protein ABB37_05968 [Leptomonas pyrrhocoris]|eukprot:XP_015657343.1 hypothetical protein ABB37_05968 [Leptomonas pyrrhocoris]